jgi:hypothetical protein
MSNRELFKNKVSKEILNVRNNIKKLKSNDELYKEETEKQKRSLHRYFLSEIKKYKNAENQFNIKPIIDIDKSLVAEYSSCTLFGCGRHEKINTDD